jgi:predicted dienelactone hydrolase
MNVSALLWLFCCLAHPVFAGCSGNHDSAKKIVPATGPFHVGTIRFRFIDESRPEIFTPAHDDHREVVIKLWYPAEKESCRKKAPYIEGALKRKNTLPANSPLPPHFFDRIAHVESNSFYDAAVSERRRKYPIILFSHAYGAGMSANSLLMEELASHGYITVSIGHAYETSHFLRPDGSIEVFDPANEELMKRAVERKHSLSLQRRINETNDEKEMQMIIEELMDKRPKIMESLKIWVDDISFIIDRLEELNDREGIFHAKLDLDRIGVMGHSFGGVAAGQACIVEKRCKAGVNLDGLQIGDMLKTPLEKPFMFIHHDNKGAPHGRPNEIFFNRSKNTAYMMVIRGTTHFSFSDLSLPFYADILNPPAGFAGTIDGYRCVKILNEYVRAFFDSHLRGEKAELLKGCSGDYPEVEIDIKR